MDRKHNVPLQAEDHLRRIDLVFQSDTASSSESSEIKEGKGEVPGFSLRKGELDAELLSERNREA
jgi:hypothetical protein